MLGRSPATVQSIFCQGLLAECRVLPLLPEPRILPGCQSMEIEAKQAACAPGALPRTSPVSSLCLPVPGELCFDLVGWLGEHSEAQTFHAGNLLHCFARPHGAFVQNVAPKHLLSHLSPYAHAHHGQ